MIIVGLSDEVKSVHNQLTSIFKHYNSEKTFVKSDYMYDAVMKMTKEDAKMLFTQILIECAVIFNLEISEKKKGYSLSGLYIRKAIKIVYFHLIVSFERK